MTACLHRFGLWSRTLTALSTVLFTVWVWGCGAGSLESSASSRIRSEVGRAGGTATSTLLADAAPAAAEALREAPATATTTMAAPHDVPTPEPKPTQHHIQAGNLTAGSFDDNLNPAVFRKFARKLADAAGQMRDPESLTPRLMGRRLELVVQSANGAPIRAARVVLAAAVADLNTPGPTVELLTRNDGRAVFLSGWDRFPADAKLTVTVTAPRVVNPQSPQPQSITQEVPVDVERMELVLPTTRSAPPRALDLALVIDATGSMGDEMDYLKAEIRGIVDTVKAKFPDVAQRYALIVYRDVGDEYVTRKFDFTPDLDRFRRNLAAQSADGGGDFPEAMHTALQDSHRLEWRTDADTVRLLFLVADAPPHKEHIPATLTAVDRLRKRGVSIYPLAASDADPTCELVMRSAAKLTGAQYLFLTNDSGIGNAHAEPHIPAYQVERLNALMVRLIASELAGRRIEPEPASVIRTVGKVIRGVCLE